jgi:hypothetical protein
MSPYLGSLDDQSKYSRCIDGLSVYELSRTVAVAPCSSNMFVTGHYLVRLLVTS